MEIMTYMPPAAAILEQKKRDTQDWVDLIMLMDVLFKGLKYKGEERKQGPLGNEITWGKLETKLKEAAVTLSGIVWVAHWEDPYTLEHALEAEAQTYRAIRVILERGVRFEAKELEEEKMQHRRAIEWIDANMRDQKEKGSDSISKGFEIIKRVAVMLSPKEIKEELEN